MSKMKCLMVLAIVLLMVSTGMADVISVNFFDADPAGQAVGVNEAGVVQAGNWTDWNIGVAALSGLKDDLGNPTTAGGSIVGGTDAYAVGANMGNAGDSALMAGHWYIPAGGTNSLALTAIPYAAYDLYVYYNANQPGTINFTIRGTALSLTGLDTTAGPDTTFVIADPGNSIPGNYVVFEGLTDSDITLDLTAGTNPYAYINGFQIVTNELTYPSPWFGEKNVGPNVILTWTRPFDAINVTYDIYLQKDDNFVTPVFSDFTGESYNPDSDLDYETEYFWRVDTHGTGPDPDSPDPNNPIYNQPFDITGEPSSFTTRAEFPSWDFAAEYSEFANPSGVWTYGMLDYTPGLGPQFLQYANRHTLGEINFWAWQVEFDRDQYGALNHNPTDHAVSSWGFQWKPDGINIQSATYYTLTDSSVVFTAPEAGYYSFAADFESMTDARGTEVRVVQDDLVSALWSVRLDAYGGTNVAASFDGILNMAAGEKVYFSNPAEGYEMPTMVDFNCVAALVDPEDLPEPPAWALKLWLKADTGVTTSEGVVTAWADQSGNGLDAALDAGNPMLATGSFNNGDHPVIRFDGDDALVLYDNTEPNEDPNIGNPLGLSSLSIYVVGKINANQAGSGFIVNSNVYTGWAFGVSSVEQNKFGLLSANNELRPPNPSLVDKYYLIACTISSDYQRNLYINGNLRASDNGGVNYYGDTAALIGYLLAGDIAEIRVYQGVDETENAAVQAALIDEYALNFTCFDQGVYFQADLNEDCYVNLDDVALLAGDWLKCNDPYNPDQCDPMPDPPLPPLPLPDPGAFEVKTWDYNADYPTATGGPNPNGQWYYGYLTNSVGNYPFRFAPANNYHPVPPSGNTLDIFWGNDAEGAFGKNPWPTDSDAPTWPNGMFFPADSTYLMNPGTAVRENKTTVRFVSSFEATYEVHAQFESGVTQGFDTPVYVLVNGVTVFADVISGFQDNPENNIATFSAKIALPLHGIVDFALDYIPGEGNTEPTWPNGGFHIVTFDANVTSSAYNPDDFPKPFNPADYPLDPNDADDPNNPVLIPMSPLQDPDPAPELPPLPDSDKVFLTAMTFSDTDASGNTQNLIWNTFYDGVEPAWDLALHAGTVDVYDPNVAADPNKDFWLNNDTDMMLNVPLVVGNSYDFTIHKAYYADGGPLAIVGLNLFFDDQQNSNTVGVSVYADSDTTGPGDGNPEWFAKDGIEVAGWPYTGPGYGGVGGGLTYKNYNKLIQVTITDWVYYPTTIYNIDSITRSDWDYPLVGPDGAADNIAQFSLVVEPFLLTCEEVGEYYDNDFNEDCYINLADYAEIAGDWLKCNDPEIPTCTDVPN